MSGPGSRFISVPAEALEAKLTALGFTKGSFAHEVVYTRQHARCSHTTVKVYTSLPVNGDAARGCGEDAIRVIAFFERATTTANRDGARDGARGFKKCIYKATRIHRTGSVEKILERVHERAREAYGAANEFLKGGGCFACCGRAPQQAGGVR